MLREKERSWAERKGIVIIGLRRDVRAESDQSKEPLWSVGKMGFPAWVDRSVSETPTPPY